jgi:hypothetical protein
MIIALLLVVTLFSGTPRQQVPAPGAPQGASSAGPPSVDTTAAGRTVADVTDYFAHSGAENIHHLYFDCSHTDNSKKSSTVPRRPAIGLPGRSWCARAAGTWGAKAADGAPRAGC